MRCRCPRRAPSPGRVTSTTSSRSRRSSASRSSSSRRAAKAASRRAAQRVESHSGVAVAHLTQGLGQLGVAAEEANALLLELVRGPGSRDRAQRLGFEELDVHAAETTIGPVDALEPDTTDAGASPYDPIAGIYDEWSRRVTEDIDFYVQAAIAAGGPVVELGVGTGRIAIPTARAGIPVIGVDSSARMLDVCRQRATAAGVADLLDLRVGDLRRPPVGERVRLVTCPFRAYLHLHTDDERVSALRIALALLEPGGRLMFDVFAPERRRHRRDQRALARARAGHLGASRMAARGTAARPVGARRERRDDDAARLAAPERWREVLVRAGFERIECYGWFDRRRYRGGEDTVWIAERPG